jgi:hypothetical protein
MESFTKSGLSFTTFTAETLPSEKKLATAKKDLRTYLTGCQKQPKIFMANTMWMTNPAIQEQCDDDVLRSWGAMAMREIQGYLMSKKKKRIDGEDWSVGFLGSVWKDMELSGVLTRVCYYSRKCNAESIKNVPDRYEWVIMLDPHSVEKFQ